MNSDQQLKVHISIQKGSSFPPLLQCNSCCPPGKVHCPFCTPTFFKPQIPTRVRIHLQDHLRRAVFIGEYTIHRCSLECRNRPHYHCLYCKSTLLKKYDFTHHLSACQESHMLRAIRSSQLQTFMGIIVQTGELNAPALTPGENDVPAYDTKNTDDSSGIIIIQDQDDQNGGEGSSQSGSPVISESNQRDTAGMTKRSTDSPKNEQTVSTNSEKPQDCDEYYFMGLLEMFKRLSPQKKAEVSMKIERLLFEAGFE